MKKIIYGALSFAPVLALAAETGVTGTLQTATSIVDGLKSIVDKAQPIAFALAFVFFFYGVARYILAAGDPGNAAKGKSIMIYGVIAIAVMASISGLVAFLQKSFGVDSTSTINRPTISN